MIGDKGKGGEETASRNGTTPVAVAGRKRHHFSLFLLTNPFLLSGIKPALMLFFHSIHGTPIFKEECQAPDLL